VSPASKVLSAAGLLLMALLAPIAPGCHCSQGSEPDKNPDYDPTSPDGLAKPPPTPEEAAGMTRQELKDYKIKLAHELCDDAYQHINVVHGRDAQDSTDKMAIGVRGQCIMKGNNAWYKCQAKAETVDALATCNKLFLSN